jgi:DNA-directed DNA polymerase III PolC
MPVSLHTHSWYSLLEAVSSPEALVLRAAALGCKAIALTDTNNLYGAVAFHDLAFGHDVRPLFGACLRQHRSRCVVLISEDVGYRNLCRILSRLHGAAGDGPACLIDLLNTNADGLHALVDDPVLAERLRDAFGRRLWLEVIRPRDSSGSRHETDLLACGKRLRLLPVASTAVHFATPDEYPTFRLLTAVRQRTLIDRLPERLSITPEHHLVSPEELRHRFRDLPRAVDNGDALAEVLRSDVLPRQPILPQPQLSRPLPLAAYLRRLCDRGLRRRGLAADLDAWQRLREELEIIEDTGLIGYFLAVRAIARHARRRGHSMALRGSAGCSLVCYLLGITDVDPLHFRLPLERFLHPGRVDLPDIDLDFDWKVRDEVIEYAFRRHGTARVARISSHLFFQPRSAFREAAKVHGLSDEQISRLLTVLEDRVEDLLTATNENEPEALATDTNEPEALAMDRSTHVVARSPDRATGSTEGLPHGDRRPAVAPVAGSGDPATTRNPSLTLPARAPRQPREFPLEPQRWPRIITDARRLLGLPHYLSLHPGGIVLTPGPIEDYAPLEMAAKGVVVTQFEKDAVEQVGLVKIDLLGNRALATVDEARRHAGRARPETPTQTDRDAATADMLCRGDVLGVCQLESPAMRHLLVQMQPVCVEDVIQALALLRPGAAGVGIKESFIRRRRGLERPPPAPPRLADVLAETHGLMLYEDDALRVLQALTGLSAPAADGFRKRITKHRTPAEEQILQKEFIALCGRRGAAPHMLTELWSHLAKFNRYSFCKSHAVSYGLIAWEATYLKAHHPVAFWTAALNNNQGAYPRRVYIEAIKRAGIRILLPCVNRSLDVFTPEGDAIRTGLGAISGLALEFRQALLADREQHGDHADFSDLRRRLRPGPETLAVLIRSGACDGFGRPRPGLFLDAELEDRMHGDGPELFAVLPAEGWSPADYPEARRLRDEWDLLGFMIGPPLYALCRPPGPPPAGPPVVRSRDLPAWCGRTVRVEGLVATARHAVTHDGRPIQFITLEDEDGFSDVTLFPGTCPQVAYLTTGPYLATGVVEEQYGVFTLTARRFERWSGSPDDPSSGPAIAPEVQ